MSQQHLTESQHAREVATGERFEFGRNWRLWWRRLLKDLLCGRPLWTWHDVVDWVGGFPFEVAKPERGFELAGLSTQGGDLGCNEFVFVRKPGKGAE